MPFPAGSISFRRFSVIGPSPEAVDQDMIDKLSANALRPSDVGVPEEQEYGWSGGRHVLDAQFSFDKNVFSDAIHFGLRIDTNKVPSALKKAYTIIEEDAVAANNPSGFISKSQKKQVKDSVGRMLDDELRSGKYRRSKLLPMLWDLPGKTLYCSASGKSAEMLMELFERTFSLSLDPMTAGSIALTQLDAMGKRRDYEDSRPTRFVYGPDGESQFPEYPWTLKGAQPKDYFGNEFLLWLWHETEAKSGIIPTELAGDISLFIDKSLDLDCAYGQTGKDNLRGTGPGHMPEARDGLRSGKVPRRAGLVMDAFKQQFTFNFNAESFALGGAKLPDIEDAETPRVVFEERVGLLRDLSKSIDALFATFLKVRCSSNWEGQCGAIRRWIMQSTKPIAAVA